MRIVTYGGACSLDGFLAGADGAVDWLHWSKDVEAVMAAFWTGVDAIVMGRKTWEVAEAQSASQPAEIEAIGATTKTYVFSRTLRRIEKPNVELVPSDAGAFVADLKRQPGKGICVLGGGELAQSLFAAGVIDEVGLNIHPILLGSGIPVFRHLDARVPMTLSDCRTLEGGCVLVTFRVNHPARA